MPVMNLIAQVQRRETLLARKVSPGHYPFDIRLQYEGEIVFMDIWE
jgi:protocatechuate 3,4-dioxygenase beta subunit